MNKQEMFDKVSTHLFTQGERAMLPKEAQSDEFPAGLCAYRAPNGFKCAVGCMIPDEKYDPKMEGVCADSVIQEYHLESYIPFGDLTRDLQDTHDHSLNWATTESMKHALRYVADRHELNTTVLDTLSFKDR